MSRPKFVFPFSVCFVASIIIASSCSEHPPPEEKAPQNKQKRSVITLNPWAAKVEKKMVRYLRVSEGKFCRGYLGDNGIFYKFADEDPLDESDLPKDKEERKLRLVRTAEKVVDIERPRRYTFIHWKDDSFYPACLNRERKVLFVLLGFGKVDESEIPWFNSMGPSSMLSFKFNEDTGKVVSTSPGRWPKSEMKVIPEQPAIDAEVVVVGEKKQNAGASD